MAVQQKLHDCDLVLRGGLASGIIYPGTISSIAEHYRLRSIGGSSVGAVAAAAAAAMEYGRTTGSNPEACEQMSGIPGKLGASDGGSTLLSRLVVPDAKLRPLFAVVYPWLSRRRMPILPTLRLLWLALLPPFLVILVATGGSFAVAGMAGQTRLVSLPVIELLWSLFVALLVLLAGYCSWRIVTRQCNAQAKLLASNGFGLCSGHGPAENAANLTDWLHVQIQDLAGTPHCRPLTFRDLWLAGETADGEPASPLAKRRIDLQLITTDVTRGQCLQLPFLAREDPLFVRRSDMERLFPAPVVDLLCREGQLAPKEGMTLDGVSMKAEELADFHVLPPAEALPILFAARLSLSFPLLISAVPLYLRRNRSAAFPDGSELTRLWFSDGGITSNFPLHLFDAPVPGRPTFCINLVGDGEELQFVPPSPAPDGADRAIYRRNPPEPQGPPCYMLPGNAGRLVFLHALPAASGLGEVFNFLGNAFETARNWHETQTIDVPGYRDRIVHVRMARDEGWFAFDMTPEQIERLNARGRDAGRLIGHRFLPFGAEDMLQQTGRGDFELNWSNHRFVRARTFMAAHELAIARFAAVWNSDVSSGTGSSRYAGLAELVASSASKPSPLPQQVGYALTNCQIGIAQKLAEEFVASAAATSKSPETMDFVGTQSTSPRPKPIIRLRVSLDSDPSVIDPRA